MRAIIFGVIVAMVAFSAYAQEQDRPQMIVIPAQQAPRDGVSMGVILGTKGNVPDIKHNMPFPKNMTQEQQIDACVEELRAFLKHKFTIETTGKAATCIVPDIVENDS